MRRLLIAAALLLLPGIGWAQDTVHTYPSTSGTGGGGGMTDPGGNGIVVRTGVDTTVARTTTSPLGTLVIGNADGVSGNTTLDLDTSFVPLFSSGTATVSGNCTVGDIYLETDANLFSVCTSTNHWETMGTGGTGITTGTADPAGTCTIGQLYYETDQQDLFFCYATNAWAMVVTNTTPTDDAVLVGNGTTYQNKVIPDCDDAAGSHLNYDTTTNVFSCGTTGSGTFDPATTVDMFEDFIGGTTTTGQIGKNGLVFTALSTGTVAYESNVGLAAVFANHPGIFGLRSHVSNDNSGVLLYASGALSSSVETLTNKDWDLDTVIIPAFTGAMTSSAWFVGEAAGNPDNTDAGFWARRDTDRGDDAIVFQVCDAASAAGCQAAGDDTDSAVVASTITPTAATPLRVRLRHRMAGVGGTETFYGRINDETEINFCASGCNDVIADAPSNSTNSLTVIVAGMTRTTTEVKTLGIDYIHWTATVDRTP